MLSSLSSEAFKLEKTLEKCLDFENLYFTLEDEAQYGRLLFIHIYSINHENS